MESPTENEEMMIDGKKTENENSDNNTDIENIDKNINQNNRLNKNNHQENKHHPILE